MKELIERLEKATGPDRELDEAVERAIFDEGKEWRSAHLPYFTASLDAALTLVPEGYRWLVGNAWKDKHGSCPAMATVALAGDYGTRPTSAATPAIALCIAALKAREAK